MSSPKPFAELPAGCPPHRLSTTLKFEPPLDWHATLGCLTPRAIPGVEVVGDSTYSRTLSTEGAFGLLRVTAGAKDELAVELATNAEVKASGLTRALRRLFDLDADLVAIARHFDKDKLIGPLVHKRPGIRIPGCWDPFELTIRVILGQQVSVPGATTLTGRVVRLHGEPLFEQAGIPGLTHAFPPPQALVGADLAAPVGLPRTRARSISGLAAAVASDPSLLADQGELDDVVARLVALPGIGPWTANYVAMRGLRKDDAFPESDLGLLRAATKPGRERLKPSELLRLAERWRPLRGYPSDASVAFGDRLGSPRDRPAFRATRPVSLLEQGYSMASVVGGDEVCTPASARSMPKRIHSARRTGGRACRRHGYPTIPDRHGIDACQSNLAE